MRDGNLDPVPRLPATGHVVSLPMRDGNYIEIISVYLQRVVVSLPMRDGNHPVTVPVNDNI